jgi:FecR protein
LYNCIEQNCSFFPSLFMPSMPTNCRRFACALTSVAFACSALAQSAVFDSIKGSVLRDGTRIVQGQEAVIGSTITTAADGQATLRFEDGQRLAVGPNTALVLERYSYVPARPAESASWLNLLRGGLRYVSGSLAKANPNAFRLSTPTATIGIRGSIVAVAVIEGGAGGVAGAAGVVGGAAGVGSVSMQVLEGIGTMANGAGTLAAGAGSVVASTGALGPVLSSLAALPAGAAGILQGVNAIQFVGAGAAGGASTTAGTTGGATGGAAGTAGGVTGGVGGAAGTVGAVGAAAAPATLAGVGLTTVATGAGLAAATAAVVKAASNTNSTVSHH